MMKKVLIIEDYEPTAEMLKTVLEGEGYQVQVAADGRRGLEKSRSWLPGLILLDIMMPGMDGIQVCRELKANERTAAIPVVIVSVKAREEDIKQGKGSGAADYVVKPFEPDRLLEIVRQYFK